MHHPKKTAFSESSEIGLKCYFYLESCPIPVFTKLQTTQLYNIWTNKRIIDKKYKLQI